MDSPRDPRVDPRVRPIVLVTGGRDFRDAEMVDRVLAGVRPGLVIEGGQRSHNLNDALSLGDALDRWGADYLCAEWAHAHGVHTLRVDALWRVLGKPAGPRRNAAMVRIATLLKAGGAEVVCVAFPGGSGTADCVRQATAGGLVVMDAAALDHPATRALVDAFGATIQATERGVHLAPTGREGGWGMRLAYGDPPYTGQAVKHYGHDPRCAEVDFRALIEELCGYDGWGLSNGADLPALRAVVPFLPDGVRVCPWIKPFASFKPNVTLAYAWEPIYIMPARRRGRDLPTVRDWVRSGGIERQTAGRRARRRLADFVSANITLKRGLSGAKPEAVCWWLFDALGAEPGDTFTDLFPGTGG